MSCLLEVREPRRCGDIIKVFSFGFAHIADFCLFILVHHTWVFMQIFVKGHAGQLFNVPFDANVMMTSKLYQP